MNVATLLRAEIASHGPLPFSRFMELALYDPTVGYYRRDHFGKDGDFYTAEQLQPTFGLLLRRFCDQHGITTIVHPGAGRAALGEAFAGLEYVPIELAYGAWPESFQGLILAHEFFDALLVDVAEREGEGWRELLVGDDGAGFVWTPGAGLVLEGIDERIERVERPVGLATELTKMAARLSSGYLLVLDYGYTRREQIRFPQGSLMGYRHHQPMEDVLANPGEQDITAHVPLSTLEEEAHRLGFRTVRAESMGSFLLRIGEADHFAFLNLEKDTARRLQLKTLLFDLGESFRALLLEKPKRP